MTVATYGRLDDCFGDWDRLGALSIDGSVDVVDAALVESDASTVTVMHHVTQVGTSRGAAVSAVVALLRPAALISGALAGGVGVSMMDCASRGLRRLEVKALGEVFDEHPYAIVAVLAETAPELAGTAARPWWMATAVATARATFDDDDVLWALLSDSTVE